MPPSVISRFPNPSVGRQWHGAGHDEETKQGPLKSHERRRLKPCCFCGRGPMGNDLRRSQNSWLFFYGPFQSFFNCGDDGRPGETGFLSLAQCGSCGTGHTDVIHDSSTLNARVPRQEPERAEAAGRQRPE